MDGYLIWAIVATLVALYLLIALMNVSLTLGALFTYNAAKGLPEPTNTEQEALKLWLAKMFWTRFGFSNPFLR